MAQKGAIAAGVDRQEIERTYGLFLLVSKASRAAIDVRVESSRSPSVRPCSIARAVIRSSTFSCIPIIGTMSVGAAYN